MGATALLLPDEATHTHLELQAEGLELLRSIKGDIRIVGVVGAYRSGKSWLLNELMQIGCDDGFVVGHRRQAQTKGVWLMPSTSGVDNGTMRLYMDTEGFEGTGQVEVYDDRIFAFAALISSVLVYNLAETIKQADIERLAFAATLSSEFFRRASSDGHGGGAAWLPPALLWLVQRDFLEGGTPDQYLQEALQPTAGATDEHIQRLNKVREALGSFGRMRAMGLVQPHARRTELCSLPRSALDGEFLRGSDAVRTYVAEHARAPRGEHGARSGEQLASLVTRLVRALNTHEIPTAGSVVETFNRNLAHGALETLRKELQALPLPLPQAELEAAYGRLLAAAERSLREQSFGATEPAVLDKDAQESLRYAPDANIVASQKACDTAWGVCQAGVRSGKVAWLPSTGRFASRVAACNATLASCVGPASARFHQSLLPQLSLEGTSDCTPSWTEETPDHSPTHARRRFLP
jgi:hypothetical protein